MIYKYKVLGMTCQNCKITIEALLNKSEHILSVNINREKEEMDVKMSQYMPPHILQKKLPQKHTIRDIDEDNDFSTLKDEKTTLQQLKPLFLILIYITAAANLIHYFSWVISAVMLDFMGLFFIIFSFFKMLDLKGFCNSFREYDPLARKIPSYAWIYPFIETALGLMLLMRFEIKTALITTIIVLGITTIGVTKILLDKKSIRCACLGTVLKLPMTEATFIENALMIIMAMFMLLNF